MAVALKKLINQVIVITGASSGIGLATARMAAKRGARLVLAGRSRNALRQLRDEIRESGRQAVAVIADVAKQEDIRRIARAAEDTFGGFDTWVNNAGVSIFGKLEEVPIEDMRHLFETDFWSVVYGSLEAAKHLKRRGGALINVGSVVSERSVTWQGIYSASKHAVKGFTDALRMELESENAPISVTLIEPTSIDTPFSINAKNYMDKAPTLPPPVYAPDAVSRAILHCAETPTRDVFVGGGAKGIALLGYYAPRLADMLMEWTFGPLQRKPRPARPREQNALDHPSERLQERGDYSGHVAETSLYTQASLHPLLTGAVLVGAGLAAAALWRGSANGARRRASSRNGEARPASPVRYDSSIEQMDEEESQTIAEVVETMLKIHETTSKDYGHSVRATHTKSHGLLQGELHVLGGLPATLAHGLFAKPGTYPVVMRLSTQPGDLLDDSVSSTRGLAIKVVGVEGERLPGSEGQVTQDFIMQDAPAFQSPHIKDFAKRFKLLAATADTGQAWKKAFSAAMRGVESVVESVGGKSPTLRSLGGHPMTHILGETYYTQVPLLYGPYMAKMSIAPVSPELRALAGAPLDVTGKPNGLREAVVDFFGANGAEWELRVQLCTDLGAMPIEDASVRWPEDQSPYVAVARITVPPQAAWSEARSAAVDDGLAFSPWHGLAAHRPLGSIMRARKVVYETSARFRQEHNKHVIEEPRELGTLPS